MCLNPIKIYNPTKKLSLRYNQRFEIEVPCGQCAECKTIQKNEWFFRAYWQCQDCFDHGGYVYFDTLTYRDLDLPHISDYYPEFKNRVIDYPCFSNKDWTIFINSLREYLVRDGWIIDDKLKYFMSSEYGTSEFATHRPHYHILLFVQITDRWTFKFIKTKSGQSKKVKDCIVSDILSADELCKYVAKAWTHGFVDNYQHQFVWKDDKDYVNHHTYGPGYTSDDKYLRAVCQYVSKYVMKDSEFEKTIDNRIQIMLDSLAQYDLSSGFHGVDYDMSDYQKDYWKKVIRQTHQFHRQSQGFGLYYREKFTGEDYDRFMDSGMVELPVAVKKSFKHVYIPMPRYLFIKIFKDKIYDSLGQPYYVLNGEGLEFKYNQTMKNIDLTEKRFNTLINNLPNQYILPLDDLLDAEGNIYHLSQEECLKRGLYMKNKVLELLNGRSIKDYVIYSLLYKGRIKSHLDNPLYIDSLDDMIENLFKDIRYELDDEKFLFYNYQQKGNRRFYGRTFVSTANLETVDEEGNRMKQYRYRAGYNKESELADNGVIDICDKLSDLGYSAMGSKEFAMIYTYNSFNTPEFKGFDELSDLFKDCYYYINKRKQNLFDWKESRQKRKKELNLNIYKRLI